MQSIRAAEEKSREGSRNVHGEKGRRRSDKEPKTYERISHEKEDQ